jgi:hypothetical protein
MGGRLASLKRTAKALVALVGLLCALACDPGDLITVHNDTGLDLDIYWHEHYARGGPDLQLTPGQRLTGVRLNSAPGSKPITVRAFERSVRRDLVFCRTFQPQGFRKGALDVEITGNQVQCD